MQGLYNHLLEPRYIDTRIIKSLLPLSCWGGGVVNLLPFYFFYITQKAVEIFWLFLNTQALPLGLKPDFYTNCLSPQAHCLNDCFFLYQTKSLFWPTFSCQILISFSFLESLWHKETDCTSFAKKFLQIICIEHVKRNLHIFRFS